MRKIFLILTALGVIGCKPMTAEQRLHDEQARYIKYIDTVCLRGVVYYADKHNLVITAPAYNQDGSLMLCIDDEEFNGGK